MIVDAKEADDEDIALVHTKKHIDLIKNISSKKLVSQRNKIASRFNSIYFNEGSSEAAYLAAGSVIKVIWNRCLYGLYLYIILGFYDILALYILPKSGGQQSLLMQDYFSRFVILVLLHDVLVIIIKATNI